MRGPADTVVLDLDTGDLRVSTYGSDARTAATDVDAMKLDDAQVEHLDADGSTVHACLEYAVDVTIEDQGGRRVAVLSGLKP